MILIPARLESTRLHHKARQYIGNVPMIVRTAQSCQAATSDRVVVATDSALIRDICTQYHINSVLTEEEHETGTDRIYEAALILGLSEDEVVINVQGDYPFVNENDLGKLGNHPAVNQGAIVTLYKKRCNPGKANPDIVKAVMDNNGQALYFSRAPIPYPAELHTYFEHVGLYAMKVSTLRRFCETPRGDLERLENIEHLRALENGIEVHLVKTEFEYVGVNTQEDLTKARSLV